MIELDFGITVYPPQPEPEGTGGKKRSARWRAVCYEDGERQQCESVSEEKLAAELEKVKERLEADAPGMKQPGADNPLAGPTSAIGQVIPPPRIQPQRAARHVN